ncbi:unnamed protein product, partial [Pleuronectes platessa]
VGRSSLWIHPFQRSETHKEPKSYTASAGDIEDTIPGQIRAAPPIKIEGWDLGGGGKAMPDLGLRWCSGNTPQWKEENNAQVVMVKGSPLAVKLVEKRLSNLEVLSDNALSPHPENDEQEESFVSITSARILGGL